MNDKEKDIPELKDRIGLCQSFPLQFTTRVHPGRIISELKDWFDQNPDFPHFLFTRMDVENLRAIADIIEREKNRTKDIKRRG